MNGVTSRLLTLGLLLGTVSGALTQPAPSDLVTPISTAATGVTFLRRPGAADDLVFFNGKDQPMKWADPFNLYGYYVSVHVGQLHGVARRLEDLGRPVPILAYPSMVFNGGYSDEEFIVAAKAMDPLGAQLYVDIGEPADAAWISASLPDLPTCLASPCRSVEYRDADRWMFIGYDHIGTQNPTSYFSYGDESGYGLDEMIPIPRGAIPGDIALYDAAVEDMDPPACFIAAATRHIDRSGFRPPFVIGSVETDNLYWSSNVLATNPVWNVLDPSTDELRNLQLAMRRQDVCGVALDATNDEFVVYRGRFVNHILSDWREVQTITSPPNGSVPYDVEVLQLRDDIAVMLVAASSGLWISLDDGVHWASAAGEMNRIQTLELRDIAVDAYIDPHRVAVAGFYASYFGEADDSWNFAWQEVSYFPSLYQHYSHAWSSAQVGDRNVALIDHGSDPAGLFPDPKAVILQVDQPSVINSALQTISIGFQDAGTRPWLRVGQYGSGPFVVFNWEGDRGPSVATAGPDLLSWNQTPLFNDVNGAHVPVSDVCVSGCGDFIMFDNRPANNGHTNQLWRNLGQGWQSAICNGLGADALHGYVACSEDGLYYLCPNPNTGGALYKSTNVGDDFAEYVGNQLPAGWANNHYNAVSTGYGANMPLYVGARTPNNGGRLLQRVSTGQLWTSLDFAPTGLGEVKLVVADPYSPFACWIASRNAQGIAQLSRVVMSTMPPNSVETWWKPQGNVNEYSIQDIQLIPAAIAHRVLDLTLRTPDSNADGVDHTVVKRWDFNVFVPGTPLPAVMDGTWYLDSDATIASDESVTIQAGAVIVGGPGVSLVVEGTLFVDGTAGNEVVFRGSDPNQAIQWHGIDVHGAMQVDFCTIDGATIGIETQKATSVTLTDCRIQNCGTGFSAYQPVGTGHPLISGCQFVGNDDDGLSLLATSGATIMDCEFTNNGGNGVLLTNSFAKINSNQFTHNGVTRGGYGLSCYGSSPYLDCNSFENNGKGEMALYNQSYPVLWGPGGSGTGGVNTFVNDTQTLISMWDSYPVTTKGHNSFTVGSTGYFMADMSAKPPQRDITGNFWNPSLALSKLYPSSANVYTWSSVDPLESVCGSEAHFASTGPEAKFVQGFHAESNGQWVDAMSAYQDNVSEL
jgi:hypothetical protein